MGERGRDRWRMVEREWRRMKREGVRVCEMEREWRRMEREGERAWEREGEIEWRMVEREWE